MVTKTPVCMGLEASWCRTVPFRRARNLRSSRSVAAASSLCHSATSAHPHEVFCDCLQNPQMLGRSVGPVGALRRARPESLSGGIVGLPCVRDCLPPGCWPKRIGSGPTMLHRSLFKARQDADVTGSKARRSACTWASVGDGLLSQEQSRRNSTQAHSFSVSVRACDRRITVRRALSGR